ncbi:hypothetical protein F030043B2_34490 [Bacteroides fragilis]|uniref:S24 family peptidase n=1 Tax=Bacteroides fragilis TaxID=817 RepID=UPI0008189D87|nr:S24 family peptidase [Bacteroides fragilis]OCR34483.1 hypothetical protein AC141_33690 [Bacteroides fragilis]USA58870.1 helix-turn-helix transcriptional regulator [Bacteroides fragilis]
MEESAKTRFLAYLKEKGIGQTKCEEMCGISRGYLSKIKDNFGTDMLNKISIAFPSLNVKWIISGLGEMEYKSEKEVIKNDGIESTKKDGYITYLLPMSAMGGSLTGFAEPGILLQNCEAVVSPIENVDFAITVYGDSMAPEYPSGSRILIKKINPDLFIDWGKVYVLDTPNGVLVKEIHESNREGYVSCYSINSDPKFKPFDVLMDEVFGMYRVLMCLSAK